MRSDPSEGYLLDPTVYPVGAEPELYTIELNNTAIDATEEIIKGNIAIIEHYRTMAKHRLKRRRKAQSLKCS